MCGEGRSRGVKAAGVTERARIVRKPYASHKPYQGAVARAPVF